MNFEEYLDYNPDTGYFTIKKGRPGSKFKVGDRAESKGKYLRLTLQGKTYQAQNVAWFLTYGAWPEGIVDHINRDKHDNRIENLRDATYSINNSNKPSRYSHGFKGLKKVGSRWRVQKSVEGKTKLFASTECLGKALKAQKEVFYE